MPLDTFDFVSEIFLEWMFMAIAATIFKCGRHARPSHRDETTLDEESALIMNKLVPSQ